MKFKDELKIYELAQKRAVGGGQCADTSAFREMGV